MEKTFLVFLEEKEYNQSVCLPHKKTLREDISMETQIRTHKVRNTFFLLLTSLIWGAAFVAQSVGMDYVEPFTFNGIRCLIGSLVLLPCIFFFDRFKTSEEKEAVKSGLLR